MADGTKIEWTDATWNPITGCAVVSPGCTNCYAMKLAGTRLKHHESRAGLTRATKAGPVWTGDVRFNPQWLDQPLRWRRPRMIFVCAHGDLFAEGVPDTWIDQVFAVMALAPQHVFQVLTKRPERMRAYLDQRHGLHFAERLMRGARQAAPLYKPWTLQLAEWAIHPGHPGSDVPLSRDPHVLAARRNAQTFPLPNVWLGASVEDQARADQRREPMAALAEMGWLAWVSYEPALAPVDWAGWDFARWIVSGGESGEDARPTQPEWHRSTRDFCVAHGVAFLFKQWGEFLPVGQVLPKYGKVHGATAVKPGRMKLHYGGTRTQPPKHAFSDRGVDIASTSDGLLTFRVGKKAAGRLLDAVEHNGFPEQHR